MIGALIGVYILAKSPKASSRFLPKTHTDEYNDKFKDSFSDNDSTKSFHGKFRKMMISDSEPHIISGVLQNLFTVVTEGFAIVKNIFSFSGNSNKYKYHAVGGGVIPESAIDLEAEEDLSDFMDDPLTATDVSTYSKTQDVGNQGLRHRNIRYDEDTLIEDENDKENGGDNELTDELIANIESSISHDPTLKDNM